MNRIFPTASAVPFLPLRASPGGQRLRMQRILANGSTAFRIAMLAETAQRGFIQTERDRISRTRT